MLLRSASGVRPTDAVQAYLATFTVAGTCETCGRARPSVAAGDIDPATGRARLSYRCSAELFENHTTGFDDRPYTLHRLRIFRLTHAGEGSASTPVLMKLSGHTSPRSLVDNARISDEGLRRHRPCRAAAVI